MADPPDGRLPMAKTGIRIMAWLGRLYLRQEWVEIGKWFLWERVLEAHVNGAAFVTSARTRCGLVHRVCFPDLIQKYIYYFGIWEPSISRYIESALEPGDVFVDIGANIGYYTCLAADRVGPSGAVHSVEASPSIHHELESNVARNGLRNVTTYCVAASNTGGTLRVFKHHGDNLGASKTSSDASSGDDSFSLEAEVPCERLERIVPADTLHRARIIKIDVEGGEWSVIDGIKDSLGRFSAETEWFVEVSLDGPDGGSTHFDGILEVFADAGYKAYQVRNPYSAAWYMQRDWSRCIQPLTGAVTGQVDLLFSKREVSSG